MSDFSQKPVEYLRCGEFDSTDQVKFHEHLGTELILLTAGVCKIEVNGFQLAGQANFLFVIPAATAHNQLNTGRVGTRYVIFRKDGSFDDQARVIDLASDRWIAAWIDELFRLQSENHTRFNEFGEKLLSLILLRLSEIEADNRTQDVYPPPLRRALAFLDRNYTSPEIGLTDLAAAAGLCPEYLCALFRRHLDRTPVAMLLERRLIYADSLLGDPYLSIKEISRRSGFNDPNYFIRRFRQRFGRAPGATRH